MCIAIFKPAKSHIIKRTLATCFENNSDGAGFMWASDDKLHIRKGYLTFKSFYKAWRENVNDEDTAVIHFRIRTHGATDKANTHPHRINDRIAIAHNGIMSRYGKAGDDSDTKHFVDDVLQQLPDSFYENTGIQRLIEDSLGYSNKMILMTNKAEVYIYNEDAGEWENGCWYSNTGYKREKATMYKGKFSGSKVFSYGGRGHNHDYEFYNSDTKVWEKVQTEKNDVPDDWTRDYAEETYPVSYICYWCAEIIGEDALNDGECDVCHHNLPSSMYELAVVCDCCKWVAVEGWDECPNCKMHDNPFNVTGVVSLAEAKKEWYADSNLIAASQHQAMLLPGQQCCKCKARPTLQSSGVKRPDWVDYVDWTSYCLHCLNDMLNNNNAEGESGACVSETLAMVKK